MSELKIGDWAKVVSADKGHLVRPGAQVRIEAITPGMTRIWGLIFHVYEPATHMSAAFYGDMLRKIEVAP